MKFSLVYLCIAFNIFIFVHLVCSEVMPVPGDCKKYQMCDSSGCFVFNCGIGTEFNPKVMICDYPLGDRSLCGNRDNLGSFPVYPGIQNPTNSYSRNQDSVNYNPGCQVSGSVDLG